MKIRLVEPGYAGYHVYDLTRLPRLGLPLMATLLASRGHDVLCYAGCLEEPDLEDLLSSDLVGISSLTCTAPAAYELAAALRSEGVWVVLGGPHVSFLPEEGLAHASAVVRGEGHQTLLELVECLEAGGDLSRVLGLSWRDKEGKPQHNPPRPPATRQEFQALPWPDLGLVKGHERIGTWPVMTSWGCPYDCEFCSVTRVFGRSVRYKPAEEVVDYLERVGRDRIFFYDDNFFAPRERGVRIMELMVERGVRPAWICQMRADAVLRSKARREVDHRFLSLLSESGCHTVCIGIESVNQASLDAYGKKLDLEEVELCLEALKEYGIKVHGMFVLGSDEDGPEVFQRTVAFAKARGVDTVQLMALTPLPGTPLRARLEAEERIISSDWSLYDGHYVVHRPLRLTPLELQRGILKALRSFYSRRQVWVPALAEAAKNLRHLVRLALRERYLALQLPLLALAALVRRGHRVLNRMARAASKETWAWLEKKFGIPALRAYGRRQLRAWRRQARARAHMAWLKTLGRGGRPAEAGS